MDQFDQLNDEVVNYLNRTENITRTLKDQSGRVSDFTLGYFLTQLWGAIFIAFLIVMFFNVYRRMRGDDKTFFKKL